MYVTIYICVCMYIFLIFLQKQSSLMNQLTTEVKSGFAYVEIVTNRTFIMVTPLLNNFQDFKKCSLTRL